MPVPYFLVTFTVPEELRPLFAARPEAMHALLFRESAATLQQVAAGKRLLGADGARQRGDGHAGGVARSGAEGMARGRPRSGQRAMQLGFVGVLHTWGRQLQHHPHVHYIVPGGGLSADGKKWIAARQRDWLLPVAKLAAVFARRMEEAVRAEAPAWHATAPAGMWRRHWSVHSQPAGGGESVVRYLARYVGRTAISDERIVAADDEHVTFRYTDSATQQRRLCTLEAAEFLRRYLQHVPPAGQHRVRYFGWMHPAAKRRRMLVETLLQKPIVVAAAPPPEATRWHLRCPHCERFTLVRVGAQPRQARAPPRLDHSSPPR